MNLAVRIILPVLALAGLTACSSAGSATPSGSSVSSSVLGVREQTRTYAFGQAITGLVINGAAGNVTVTGSARNTVEVTEHLYYSHKPPDTTRTVSGGTLTAGYSCPIQVTCLVSYDVSVPAAIAVSVSTRAGAIRIDDVRGAVTASADAGNIHADGIASGSASLTTLAGAISVSFTAPPSSVTATSHAGSITILVPSGVSYHVTARTFVGSTTIGVPRDDRSARSITAHTDVGSVTVSPLERP